MTVSSRTIAISRKPEFVNLARQLGSIDNARAAWAVARQWLVIALAVTAAIWSGHWLVYVAAIVVVSTRQHALGVLMHDASHYRLFTNRKANEIVGNFACALPIGFIVSRYRADHSLHHREPNSDNDPNWRVFQANPRHWSWPKRPLSALVVFARDTMGANSLKFSQEFLNWTPVAKLFGNSPEAPPLSRLERATASAFLASVLSFLWLTNGWMYFALLWILPYVTVSLLLVRIRTIAEHHGLPEGANVDATRHIDPGFLESLCIAPLNVNCHLVHHLFPSIPHYNLPAMTEALFADPEFASVAHRSRGYLSRDGVIRGELLVPSSARGGVGQGAT